MTTIFILIGVLALLAGYQAFFYKDKDKLDRRGRTVHRKRKG